jgi:hypothetical protein
LLFFQSDEDDDDFNDAEEVEEEESETEQEIAKAKAEGKEKCPRCKRWIKEKMQAHLWKCQQCPNCEAWITYKSRHLKSCKGKQAMDQRQKKKCPVCPAWVHPLSYLRHITVVHPGVNLEKYRQRVGRAKTRAEKMAARKAFYEAHPEKVHD